MIIKTKRKAIPEDAPMLHDDHKRPVTRREFLSAGLIAGGATIWTPSLLSLLTPVDAKAATLAECGAVNGGTKIPFIAFDLGGGSNMTGSNVLVGGQAGQLDPLSTAGYNKLGLPDNMIPGNELAGQDFVNTEFGLAMHFDSAFLRGMLSRTSTAARAGCNGAVIPNRSDNDTGNNPHNPMYLIAKAGTPVDGVGQGASGKLMSLIGTRNSDSGGRSMAPTFLMDPEIRPTKIDRPSDATGLVDTGGIVDQLGLSKREVKAVMETLSNISGDKINNQMGINDQSLKDLLHCGYLKAGDQVFRFGPESFDPLLDTDIIPDNAVVPAFADRNADTVNIAPLVGTNPIFTADEINNNGTIRKTASVMKMVLSGNAGAGTIELGGYDYHNGTRDTGERKDFEAGQAMGACIECAFRKGVPLMLYVFTDGSLASNGNIDTSVGGRDKGEWTGDNSSTSASYFIVYNPAAPSVAGAQPALKTSSGMTAAQHQQLGHYRSSGSVETNNTTPGASNVNLLAQMVALNYMALHGEEGSFDAAMTQPNGMKHGLGTSLERLIAFESIL